MVALIVLLISAILTGCLELSDGLLKDLVPIALYPEKQLGEWFTNISIGKITNLAFDFGISLIIIKFIRKGFNQYILYTDGDPDADPLQLLINFFRAMFVAIGFDTFYIWFAKMIEDITATLINTAGLADESLTATFAETASLNLVTGIISVIFFINFFMLYIQFIRKGLEILILRIGIPIACIGLMDSNDGMFRTYIQKFFQATVAIVIQIVLSKLGVSLMVNLHPFFGIACMITAIKTPQFLQEFLIVTGNSGGLATTAYHSTRMFQTLKGLAKK